MPSKAASIQIRFLEVLKENNLLDLALEGKVPAHVLKAAKQVVLCDVVGEKKNAENTSIECTPEEHDEAEAELDEYLRHYKLDKALRSQVRNLAPRAFVKGKKYAVRSGYFSGKIVQFKGLDTEVFGCSWMDNEMHPACERFMFRAERDRLSINMPVFVFDLLGQNRDILLQGQEIGMEAV